MATYNFKKIKGKKVIEWNKGRLRGITESKERIGDITLLIKKQLKEKRKIRVLEVGCGYCRALMELKKLFGDKIETHGINLEKRWDVKLARRYGLKHKIFTKKEIDKNLPKIYILDAGKKLPFKSGSYDFIFSQASVQYIHDKALFLEEVNRLLSKNGTAIIELQEYKPKHSIEYKNLFEIWHKDKIIRSMDYLKRFKNIKFKKYKWESHVLEIKKSKNFKLNLKLITSFDLNNINPTWWGTKAIYKK